MRTVDNRADVVVRPADRQQARLEKFPDRPTHPATGARRPAALASHRAHPGATNGAGARVRGGRHAGLGHVPAHGYDEDLSPPHRTGVAAG